MQIPRTLKLAGLTIKVELDPELYKKSRAFGEARYTSQQIALDCSMGSKEHMAQNYLHELIHWIFYVLNEDDLRNNEKLVDTFAYLLHQALVTSEY